MASMTAALAVPAARLAAPLAAVGLLAGLNAPAYAAPAPAQQPTAQVQSAVHAAEAPVRALSGPTDAAGGQVPGAWILPADCPASGSAAAAGLTAQSANVLDCVATAFPHVEEYLGVGHRAANAASDHPSGRAVDIMIDNWDTEQGKAQGWVIAHFVVANAERWNVKYIIWDAQVYSTSSGTWKPYRHPSGASDPNNAHLNHVHVSTRA